MNYRYLIFILCVVIFEKSHAQESIKENFIDYISDSREHVSVHLNKDIFTPLETLWFTAYLNTSLLQQNSEESLNLQLTLYNSRGIAVDQEVYFLQNGIATGSLLLEQPAGNYFLKMQTNWMRNFPDSKPFIKQIKIIDYSNIEEVSGGNLQVAQEDLNSSKPSSHIRMFVNTMAPNDLIISFQKLKSHQTDENFFLAFHNNKKIELIKLDIKGETKVVKIAKAPLSRGIHTLLLLDKNKKMLQERVIFHLDSYVREKPIAITHKKIENDSIMLTIAQKGNMLQIRNASINIVPLQSQRLEKRERLSLQNTFKNILISEEKELFIPTDRVSLAVLNDRLAFARNNLNWNELFVSREGFVYPKEIGFDIEGTVKNWDGTLRGKISYYQRDAGQFETADIEKDGTFEFTRNYVEKGENINFSVFKNNTSISKPEITFIVKPIRKLDTLRVALQPLRKESILDTLPQQTIIEKPRITAASGIALEELEIVGSVRKEDLKRNKKLAESSFYESIKITDKLAQTIPTLSSLIRRLGFVPRINNTNGRIFILGTNPLINPSPDVIVDDFLERDGILDVPLTSIDEIYYESVGISGGATGVIYIYRKNGASLGMEKQGVMSYPTEEGYERQIVFFNENSSDLFNTFEKRYGTVYWKGSIKFDANGETSLSFPRYGLDGIKISIEGIGMDSSYFSIQEIIEFD